MTVDMFTGLPHIRTHTHFQVLLDLQFGSTFTGIFVLTS